jgi:23S rRNA (cytidine1920-2'-O)/16S rRNA (cytidine1409-2'-O)-methyltransferase
MVILDRSQAEQGLDLSKPPTKSSKATELRLDLEMVARGLADTQDEAKGLVMAGKVIVNDQRVDKAGHKVSNTVSIRIKGRSPFVSRAGEKLAGVIDDLDISKSFEGAQVLDVGASTGGFTQCALNLGASGVIALDVGTNQLAWELRTDQRVTTVEQTNIFDYDFGQCPTIDLVTADVSFTSLTRIVEYLAGIEPLKWAGFLVLVKPQFELARDQVPQGGVITKESDRQQAVDRVLEAFATHGRADCVVRDSKVSGRSGNVEIFVWSPARKK